MSNKNYRVSRAIGYINRDNNFYGDSGSYRIHMTNKNNKMSI